MKENCNSCRFYGGGIELTGPCLRHAPAAYRETTIIGPRFPLMHGSQWCGDYEREIEQPRAE